MAQVGGEMVPVRDGMAQVGKKVRDRRQECGLCALQWRRCAAKKQTCAIWLPTCAMELVSGVKGADKWGEGTDLRQEIGRKKEDAGRRAKSCRIK